MITEYERLLLSINSANLAANLENVNINEKILANKYDGRIISLLESILKEAKMAKVIF